MTDEEHKQLQLLEIRMGGIKDALEIFVRAQTSALSKIHEDLKQLTDLNKPTKSDGNVPMKEILESIYSYGPSNPPPASTRKCT
jgi:hypothetical protein